jgi:cyclophilin family peptidyl-prolyl cis-trans isomerase
MKIVKLNVFWLLIVILAFAQCKDDDVTSDSKDKTITEKTYPVIKISTSFGDMYAHLNIHTPKHRENFNKLVKERFYDSTEFHRNVTNFVIQGGDPNSKDPSRKDVGKGGPGYTIEAEINTDKYKHEFGALAAARQGDDINPERRSSGSQFYIVVNPNGTPNLDGLYTVFGKIVKGMEVAKTIESRPKNANGLPNTPIRMWVRELKLTKKELDELNIVLPE